MTDLKDKASEPKRVSVDGTTAEQHSLAEQIELDRYLESKKAARSKKPGIRTAKLIPPGTNE